MPRLRRPLPPLQAATGTAPTRSAGAAARTSATARSRCCWRQRPELLGGAASLLHFAPEWCFRFTPLPPGLRYVTADLDPAKGDLALDIRALDLPDAAFGAIICSHVLEHVDRDRDALAELRRVVAPGGWVLLMVPQDLARAETLRGPGDRRPRTARRAAYWQHDHVRLYGRDFADRVARRRVRRRVDRDERRAGAGRRPPATA